MLRLVIVSLCIIGGFAMVFSINSEINENIRIRHAGVTGSFYPDDPVKLRDMIETFLSQTKESDLPGLLRGLISPHAGYI